MLTRFPVGFQLERRFCLSGVEYIKMKGRQNKIHVRDRMFYEFKRSFAWPEDALWKRWL